jgi:Na+/melibiose symporter-like transporter
VLVYIAYSLATVSYQAYGAEIATLAAERTRVTAWREGFGLAGVLAAAALPEMLARHSGPRAGFAQFAMLFAPLVLIATFTAIAGSPRVARSAAPAGPLRNLWLPLANARFRWLLAAFMASGIAAAIPATLVLFYVEDIVRRPDLAAAFLVAYFAAGALGLPGWLWLSRRIGNARAWLCGMGVAIAAFVWAFFLGAGDVISFAVICVASGIALGADLAFPPAMLAHVIDDDEARGLARSEGSYFGLWNLATKLNLALAAGVALPLVAGLGYAAGAANDPRALAALAAVYALVPCVLKAGAAALLWRSPFIHGERT